MNKHVLATLEKSKHYSIAVASAMPAASFDFAPVGDVWTFGELMNHIAYGIHWWEENFIKANKTGWNPPAAKTTRQDVLTALNKAYAALESTVKKEPLKEDALAGFHATLDHITHHRGQATTYLRCKGITPPEYEY